MSRFRIPIRDGVRRLTTLALVVLAGSLVAALIWALSGSSPSSLGGAVLSSTRDGAAGSVPAGPGPAIAVESSPTQAAVFGTPVGVPEEPQPDPPPPAPGVEPGFEGVGMVTVAAGGAAISRRRGAEPYVRARAGLVFGAERWDGEWIRIVTTCDEVAWVNAAEVAARPRAEVAAPPMDFAEAVVVIDPGHGGPTKIGAVSPDGSLLEKDVNVDISRRIRDLLERPHDVDWDTGAIYEGASIPAVGLVVVTRPGDAVTADFEAGLIFRARLANALGAHALVSVHNNAGWEIDLDGPGSDVYYQSQEPVRSESERLASLLAEEFQRSFRPFDAAWVGARFVGAKSRLSPRDETSQLYGILRRSEMPAVIAEGAYLASGSEAELLRTPRFRQAYAEAVYRASVRFLTTSDRGGPSATPEVWAAGAGSGDATEECVVPSE